MPDYTIAVIEDAILVLDVIVKSTDYLTLAEITKESGLVKNKVFRILSTLEKHRFVSRNELGAYTLGLRFLEFGHRVQRQLSLLEASRPVMDWLVKETAESIFLSVIDGTEVLVVDTRESPRSVRLFGQPGRRGPIYAGGTPKVLLAFLPDEERQAILSKIELKPITPYTIVDPAELEEHLNQIRQQGFVVTGNDLDVGAHSIAAPIRNFQNRTVAAISVAGPSHRFTNESIQNYTGLVLEGATKISRALGCESY